MPEIRHRTGPVDIHAPFAVVRRSEPLLPLVPVLLIIASLLYYAGLGQFSTSSPEFMLMTMSIALFVYLLTLINIQFGVAIVIFAIGFSPEMKIMGVGNLRIEDFVVPILVVAWSTRLVEHPESFSPTPLRRPILAYLGVGLVASLCGIMMYELPPLRCVFYLGKSVEYFVMFFVLINIIHTAEEVKAYIMLFLLTGLAVSVQGILGPHQQFEGFTERRIMGPAGETGNVMGGYLMLGLAIAVGQFIYARTGGRRLLAALTGLASAQAIMMTLSRTTYVAVTVGLVAYGLFKRRAVIIAVLMALVILPEIAPDSAFSRGATVVNMIVLGDAPPSWEARVVSWNELTRAFMENPLLGRGVGYYDLGYADNEYMRVLSECGLIGLGAFLWLLIGIGRLALTRAEACAKDPVLAGFSHGFIIAYFAMLVHALSATTFSTIRSMEGFIMLLSLRVVIDNRYEEWFPKERAAGSAPEEPFIVAPALRPLPRA